MWEWAFLMHINFDETGFTGYSGYFLPFQMKGKNSNPSPREKAILKHGESKYYGFLKRAMRAIKPLVSRLPAGLHFITFIRKVMKTRKSNKSCQSCRKNLCPSFIRIAQIYDAVYIFFRILWATGLSSFARSFIASSFHSILAKSFHDLLMRDAF